MRRAFAGLATLLMLAVVVQFFLAATGAFDTAPNEESFHAHRAMGYGIILLAIVVTAAAAAARAPGRLIGMSGLVAGLTVAQVAIHEIATALDGADGATTVAGGFVFGLHAVNGLAIVALLRTTVRRAWRLSGDAGGSPIAGPGRPAARLEETT